MEDKEKNSFDEHDLREVFWMGFWVCFAIFITIINMYLSYSK
jgi:hypothetical protein